MVCSGLNCRSARWADGTAAPLMSSGPSSASPPTGQEQPVLAPEVVKEDQPSIPDILPILPTRGVAVFPGIVGSLSIGRPASRKLLEDSLPQSKIIGVFAQKTTDR